MKTLYVSHIFGEEVASRLRSRAGWLTAGVASSVAWPAVDVCVVYAGDEYFLCGTERDGKPSPPCIMIACDTGIQDEALGKLFRFTSVLSWFVGGYVDVSGCIYGSRPVLYGSRNVYSSLGIAGKKSFNCNHMPIVEDETRRKALTFWREGKRLENAHDGYAFLSFYKVVESQFRDGQAKAAWITENIEKLEGRAAQRVAELKGMGIEVSRHLYESGRCAVAHASLDHEIVDPDIPADRRRLSQDLVIMEELARLYIREELKIPDRRSLVHTRDRLAPWASLLPESVLATLKDGGTPPDVFGLHDQRVSVGLWPDGVIPGLELMSMRISAVRDGIIKVLVMNARETIILVFYLDFPNGRVHTGLEEGGLFEDQNDSGEKDGNPNESDVRAYSTFFYNVFSNGIAELTIEGREPVDCEVVIPVNTAPLRVSIDQAIDEEVDRFRKERGG